MRSEDACNSVVGALIALSLVCSHIIVHHYFFSFFSVYVCFLVLNYFHLAVNSIVVDMAWPSEA